MNVSEKLFIKEIDLAKEMWNGKTLRDSEAKEISGIEDSSLYERILWIFK